jgi:hypothetical protein
VGTNVTVGGVVTSFQEFYLRLTARAKGRDAGDFGTPDCEGGMRFGIRACIVTDCVFDCSDEERAAFESVLNSFYVHRIEDKGTDVKVATDNATAFPQIDVTFETLVLYKSKTDSFRIYYV